MRLIAKQGPLAGQVIPLQAGIVVIGRGRESDLQLPETGVSRQHARFQRGPQGWTVADLGSTNGTFVNGRRLPAGQPRLLRPGDSIAIGSSVLVVEPEEPAGVVGADVPQQEAAGRRPHPVVLMVGAVALVIVMIGMVILLVTLLQPEPEPIPPTVAGPLDQLGTAFPVPTELEGVMTSVAPMLSTGLPMLPLESEPTPTPEALRPDGDQARRYVLSSERLSLPGQTAGLERGDVFP